MNAPDSFNTALDALHRDMADANMAPTWKYVSDFVAKEPRVGFRPWLWRWNDCGSTACWCCGRWWGWLRQPRWR